MWYFRKLHYVSMEGKNPPNWSGSVYNPKRKFCFFLVLMNNPFGYFFVSSYTDCVIHIFAVCVMKRMMVSKTFYLNNINCFVCAVFFLLLFLKYEKHCKQSLHHKKTNFVRKNYFRHHLFKLNESFCMRHTQNIHKKKFKIIFDWNVKKCHSTKQCFCVLFFSVFVLLCLKLSLSM